MYQSTKEFIDQGGMIFHRHEDNRSITVAYVWSDNIEPEDRVVVYGATIHQRVENGDVWNRRQHNLTAVSRCVGAGVFVDPEGRKGKELHDFLRNRLYTLGCKRQNMPTMAIN